MKREQSIKADLKYSIHNRFDIEVINTNTGEVRMQAKAENIILDSLWTRMLAPAAYFNYIHIGTGIGPPAATDTGLFTFLVSKSTSNPTTDFNINDGWYSAQKSCQLSETEYVGMVISEVGIAHGTDASTLVTHAMLKDMNNNTITITKTDTDIINVYATVFVHWNAEGYDNGAIQIFANHKDPYESSTGQLLRYLSGLTSPMPNRVNYCAGDGVRNSNQAYTSQTISYTYNKIEKKITSSTIRLGASSGNNGVGIQSISVGPNDIYFPPDIIFNVKSGSAWYSGTNITGDAVGTGDGIKTDFSTSFPFVRSGAKVYVDGVEQTSGVTVHLGRPNIAYLDDYLKVIETGRLQDPTESKKPIPFPGYTQGYSTSFSQSYGGYCIVENPFYLDGITVISKNACTVTCSDDMISWVSATASASSPNYNRYFRIVTNSTGTATATTATVHFTGTYDGFKNIVFDTPPAAGSIITADYTTDSIGKDENHVFDFSYSISLGERTT